MAAVIAPISTRPHRHLEPAPTPVRPELLLIPGGRQAARHHARHQRAARPVHPSVYLRRRLGVLLVLVSLVVLGYLAVTGLGVVLRGDAGRVTTPPAASADAGAVSGAAPIAASTYVVQPGDTLWSIARSLHPSRDIRAVVDDLADRAGPGPLQAGQRLSVDGLAD